MSPTVTQEGLTGLKGATVGAQQWRLTKIHLVNWGGFDGATTVDLDGRSALIAGATGSGKSSLLDAWSAVLQPPQSTAFNAASNDAGSQRAKGARTVLSYLRGKTGETPTANGRGVQDVVLRPGAQWAGVALVLTSTGGRTYTVGRLMYASADAARPGDVSEKWFTYPGDCGLLVFEPFAQPTAAFHTSRLREALPGIDVYPSWKQAADEAFLPTLGIGQGGDGRAALRLLHDIQRGAPIPSVNDLFTQRVLDRPGTFERFDRGIAEFDHLVATHDELTAVADKIAVLRPLPEAAARYEASLRTGDSIGGLGDLGSPASPFALWQARTWVRLLDEHADTLVTRRDGLQAESDAAQQRHDRARAELDDLQMAYARAGGDRLHALESERARLADDVARVRERRRALAERTAALADVPALGEVPADATAWAAAQSAARAARTQAQGDARAVHERRDSAQHAHHSTLDAVRTAREALDEQAGRTANIPRELDASRGVLAATAGLASHELPFVGELVDLAPGEDAWRTAADAVLGAFARTVLVDRGRRSAFNRAIDAARLPRRVAIRSADAGRAGGDDLVSTAPAGSLAAKLVVRADSPYAAWLRAELDARFRHECVADASGLLDDDVPRVTRTGQERRGDRGAHGGRTDPLIGFTNAERVRLLQVSLREAEAAVPVTEGAVAALDAELGELARRERAAAALLDADWSDLDDATPAARLAAVDAELAALRGGDDSLAALEDRVDAARAAERAAGDDAASARAALRDAVTQLDAAYERKEPHLQRAERLERDGVRVTDAQVQALDARLAADGEASATVTGFGEAARRIASALVAEHGQARDERQRTTRELESTFERFCERWPDPDLATTADAYPDYLDLLAELESHGVEATRRAWADKVVAWTTEHALQMYREFGEANQQIAERLEPVQAVLATVPFSARGNHLRIRAELTPSTEVAGFIADMRAVTDDVAGAPADGTDEQALAWAQGRFDAFARLLDRVRARPEAPGQRDRLLDVRLHHTFTAEEVAADGSVPYRYDTLGGKSGGETQELIAFISGAALRYQLGDDDREKPRFAPVLLDEAFIKADELTSHRGVLALERLGFQPIVVAPEGSVQALERHVDRLLVVTKGPDDRSAVHPLVDA